MGMYSCPCSSRTLFSSSQGAAQLDEQLSNQPEPEAQARKSKCCSENNRCHARVPWACTHARALRERCFHLLRVRRSWMNNSVINPSPKRKQGNQSAAPKIIVATPGCHGHVL